MRNEEYSEYMRLPVMRSTWVSSFSEPVPGAVLDAVLDTFARGVISLSQPYHRRLFCAPNISSVP